MFSRRQRHWLDVLPDEEFEAFGGKASTKSVLNIRGKNDKSANGDGTKAKESFGFTVSVIGVSIPVFGSRPVFRQLAPMYYQ